METTKRPFEIKLIDIGEVRMGSPYNHCNIEFIGTDKIKIPKDWWQDKYAWTEDSKRLVLIRWDFEHNEPSFHLFLIDTENGKTLESPKIFGLPDNVFITGDTVFYKKFLYDKAKTTAGNLCCYFDEEYQFHW